MQLSKRMQHLTFLITEGNRLADVGTDSKKKININHKKIKK